MWTGKINQEKKENTRMVIENRLVRIVSRFGLMTVRENIFSGVEDLKKIDKDFTFRRSKNADFFQF